MNYKLALTTIIFLMSSATAFAQSPLQSPTTPEQTPAAAPTPATTEPALATQPWVTSPAHLDWSNPPLQCIEDNEDLDPKEVPNQPAIIDKIYEAGKTYDLPPNILYGALRQESDLVDYGIIYDLGNYSCGMAQINISEWCQFVQTLPYAKQEALGWPSSITDCEKKVKPHWLKKAYNAITRKSKKPQGTELEAEDYGTKTEKFVNYIQTHPKHNAQEQAVLSFVEHCGHFEYAIPAKAEILKDIFDKSVPSVYHSKQRYASGTGPKDWKCKVPYPSHYFPFHTGWLIADGIYNLGDELVDLVAEQVKTDFKKLETPDQLIYAIKNAGVLDTKTSMLKFKDLEDNKTKSTSWFRTCIVDRHITNVVNFSLDDEYKQKDLLIAEVCENYLVKDSARRGVAPPSRVEFEKSRNPNFKYDRTAEDQSDTKSEFETENQNN